VKGTGRQELLVDVLWFFNHPLLRLPEEDRCHLLGAQVLQVALQSRRFFGFLLVGRLRLVFPKA